MNATRIEWADITINPIVGCSKCSPSCDNCYVERFAARLAKNPKTAAKYAGVVDESGKWNGQVVYDLQCMNALRGMRKPRRIFVGSMGDIFHQRVSFDKLRLLFCMMDAHSQHTYCLLTKRPERMYSFCADNANPALSNVWLGVTVRNQAEADEKIPILLQTPAAKRFVSVEPMLGAVDMSRWVFDRRAEINHLVNGPACLNYDQADARVAYPLDWVICGGETGPGARDMKRE